MYALSNMHVVHYNSVRLDCQPSFATSPDLEWDALLRASPNCTAGSPFGLNTRRTGWDEMPELVTCWETAAMPIRIEQGIPTAGLYGALIDDGNVLIRVLQLHRNLTSMRGEAHAPHI